MARALFQMVVSREKKGEMIDSLKQLRDRTRSCLGYLSASIEQDIEDSRKIRLIIVLDSPAHLEKFLQSNVLVSICQLIELSIEKPDIFVSWEDGSQTIESLIAVRTLRRNPGNQLAMKLLHQTHRPEGYSMDEWKETL